MNLIIFHSNLIFLEKARIALNGIVNMNDTNTNCSDVRITFLSPDHMFCFAFS